MSEHWDGESEAKKPKMSDHKKDELFATIGQQAENVDSQSQENQPDVVYSADLRDTGAEDAQGRPVQEIDSMCMNCHKEGVTRLLFTSIPGFREVIVMSFECPHCGFKSNEIQTAAEIQEKGQTITFKCEKPADIGRQVVKTDSATCKFPQLDIEIPPGSGRLTTIEGILSGMREDLEGDQPVRKHVDPDMYNKIEEIITKIDDAANGKTLPLTFILDDPSGNSFVSFLPDELNNQYVSKEYFRTPQQSRSLGMNVPDADIHKNESVADKVNSTGEFDENVPQDMREEVQTFNATCPSCQAPTPTHMKVVNIPHFKDVIIMSTVCHDCGYKSNEVKTGGAIPDKGRRVTLELTDPEDLSRDMLKSETCTLKMPELDLDLTAGTLGGRFTTIEGLLRQVYDELESKVFAASADSMDEDTKTRWASFLARLQSAIDGQLMFTLIMEDPLAASYVQNAYAPDPDPHMKIEDYERSHEENEELGLNDMQTESHAEPHPEAK